MSESDFSDTVTTIDLRNIVPISRRNNIIREIYTSEQVYVNKLNDITEVNFYFFL